MARYNFTMKRTASATLDVGSILAAAASPRRFELYEVMFSSEAPAADNQFLWEINKRTGTATGGSGVTGQTLDEGDTIASTLVGNQAPTANGAGSGNKLSFGLNQRAPYRYVAGPRGGFMSAATASSGYGFSTPTSSAVAVTVAGHVDER